MAKPRVLVSRVIPDEVVSYLAERADLDAFLEDRPMPRADLLRRLAGRQGLICAISEVIDEELLSGCPELRVVSNVAVGFNNVDVPAATRHGVVITNTPDV